MTITATNASFTVDVVPPFSIDASALANGQYLIYNSTTEKFENKDFEISGGVPVTSGTSVGAGSSIFAQKNSNALEFKSLVGGTGITLSSDGTTVTITNDTAGATVVATGSNTGSGQGVFKDINGTDMRLKSIVAGSDITVTSNADEITIASTATGASGASAFNASFRINFNGSGDYDNVADLPTGWSATNAGNLVTITHAGGRAPKVITYMGFDDTDDIYQMRFPTSGYQASVPQDGTAQSTTQFKLNINSSVAGADLGGHAIVNVVF